MPPCKSQHLCVQSMGILAYIFNTESTNTAFSRTDRRSKAGCIFPKSLRHPEFEKKPRAFKFTLPRCTADSVCNQPDAAG